MTRYEQAVTEGPVREASIAYAPFQRRSAMAPRPPDATGAWHLIAVLRSDLGPEAGILAYWEREVADD